MNNPDSMPQFVPGVTPSTPYKSLVVLIASEKILCHINGDELIDFIWSEKTLNVANENILSQHYLGEFNGEPIWAWEVNEENLVLPRSSKWSTLRSLLGQMDDQLFVLAGMSNQIINWWQEFRFCGRCGNQTELLADERAKYCDPCNAIYYPRISPCIIVVVTRGEHCLLARNAAWKNNYYSALAGFVECGENAEQALAREVMEEVGIRVNNIRYFGSQSWPFPSQLMLGFHADYAGGEICVDGTEIADAQWWRYDRLPPCPGTASISGRLIQDFVAQCHNPVR